jgi:hypothetical protein
MNAEQKTQILAMLDDVKADVRGLTAERDTLQKAYDLSNATNSRLVARIAELEAAVDMVSGYIPCAVWDENVLPCLARTPAQSVAHIEAAVLRQASKRLASQVATCERRYGSLRGVDLVAAAEGVFEGIAEELTGMADRIEQRAKS